MSTLPASALHGRAMVVTASGIGRATALHLAAMGCSLALTDADQDAGRDTCKAVRDLYPTVEIVFATLDATNDESVGKLMRTFIKTFKRLDGLVNCCGINLPLSSTHLPPPELFSRTMAVNYGATVSFCQHFIRDCLSPNTTNEAPVGGYSIVNFGGPANLPTAINSTAYAASVSAVAGFSKALAREYGPVGIRVNVISPGFILTNWLTNLIEPTEISLDDLTELTAVKRIGKESDVVPLVAFLLGPESAYITGATIPVDGGL